MKDGIHPDYRFVVFRDVSTDFQIITRSCIETKDTCEIDGVEYPLYKMDVSSASHPFYTGQQKIMDSAGRIDKFYERYGFSRPEGQ